MATQQRLGNNEVAVDIIPGPEEELLVDAAANELRANSRQQQLARLLSCVGSWILMAVFNRIVYGLPDPGGIFEGHQVAYCLTLFVIFLAGVAEVYAATSLSSGHQLDGRACARPLLCAAVAVLLAAFLVAFFGGTPVLVMG